MKKNRLKELLAEYGNVALYTYFGLFALVLLGFAAAIKLGIHAEGATGSAGVLGAAWVATKLTQPLRIMATVVLTPLLAQAMKRWRPRTTELPTDQSLSS